MIQQNYKRVDRRSIYSWQETIYTQIMGKINMSILRRCNKNNIIPKIENRGVNSAVKTK